MGDQEHYSSTARALASQYNDYSDDESNLAAPTFHRSNSHSPLWSRRSLDSTPRRPQRRRDKYLQYAEQYYTRGYSIWTHLSPLQRAGAIFFSIFFTVLAILAITYSHSIFQYLAPVAKRWRNAPGGWLILWVATFFVSFPPMIGYSTCVTTGGFVFGMTKGWLILSSATILGSTTSFLLSRTVLKNYVSDMTKKSAKFSALAMVLKHDGIKLLIMIRLCPLPYSFSNGAISTIPTVTWQKFMLATAIASPKLLLHVFVGRQLGVIAESGDKMSFGTKVVSYTTMVIGIGLGIGTGYLIYSRTVARAAVLEAEEAAAARGGNVRRSSGSVGGYTDDGDDADEEDARQRADVLRERQSDVSLHTTYEHDLERGYRDDFTDDEDATERDVFDAGDGETDDESKSSK